MTPKLISTRNNVTKLSLLIEKYAFLISFLIMLQSVLFCFPNHFDRFFSKDTASLFILCTVTCNKLLIWGLWQVSVCVWFPKLWNVWFHIHRNHLEARYGLSMLHFLSAENDHHLFRLNQYNEGISDTSAFLWVNFGNVSKGSHAQTQSPSLSAKNGCACQSPTW